MSRKTYYVSGIIAVISGPLYTLVGLIMIFVHKKMGYFLFALGLFLIFDGIWCIRKSKEPPVYPIKPDPVEPVSVPVSVRVSDTAEQFENRFVYHSLKTTINNLDALRHSFIVLDTETTGLSESDRIVSIAAIRFADQRPVDSFYTLVNPLMPIPEAASRVNHIYDVDVADAPLEGEMLKMLDNYLGNSTDIIVGYNISFDMRFLQRAASRNNYEREVRTYDVMTLSKREIKELKNYKQVTVAKHLGINTDKAHNSLGDCEICAQILIRLLNK